MPPPEAITRLRHVLDAADSILAMTAGRSFGDYEQNETLRLAVERQFTIIGEAMRVAAKIDPSLEGRITDLRRICDFRNVLVHDYVTVYNEAVWRIIHADLPRLLAEVRALLPPV
jgi:uncharacterized protein with HEPN domain